MMFPSVFGENLFDDWMDDFRFPDVDKALYGKNAQKVMKTDVRETDSGYEVDVDLPGFKKDEIKMQLEDGYLTISASKGFEKDGAENEEEQKEGRYIRKERYCGSCERSFYVGDGLTVQDIKANFKHGILSLSIPKKDRKQIANNKYIAIEG